jgi:hypothetical protein
MTPTPTRCACACGGYRASLATRCDVRDEAGDHLHAGLFASKASLHLQDEVIQHLQQARRLDHDTGTQHRCNHTASTRTTMPHHHVAQQSPHRSTTQHKHTHARTHTHTHTRTHLDSERRQEAVERSLRVLLQEAHGVPEVVLVAASDARAQSKREIRTSRRARTMSFTGPRVRYVLQA